MIRIVLVVVYSIIILPLISQDTLILKSGEEIPCEVIWEKPHNFKIRNLSEAHIQIYGKQPVFDRTDVQGIRDHGGHRAMKGLGKVSITFLDHQYKIKRRLYSTTPESVVVIVAETKNKEGQRSIMTDMIPVHQIETLRWYRNYTPAGAAVGGVIGLAGGIYAGHEIYDLTDSESKDSYVLSALALTAAGAGLGSLVGLAASTGKKLKINGDQTVWTRERHRIPPYIN